MWPLPRTGYIHLCTVLVFISWDPLSSFISGLISCQWSPGGLAQVIYKGHKEKSSKKIKHYIISLTFSLIERGESVLSNSIKSKFNNAMLDFFDFFDYLHFRSHMGPMGPNL
jgi:hypothetical protein